MVLCVFGVASAEKIYKWVDEDGQIHYSSQKPVGHEAEAVKVKKGPKVTPAEPGKQAATDTQNTDEDAAAKAQLAKTDAENMRRLCEQAKKNMAALNATVRVSKIDEKTGESVRMTDEQRVEAMKNAQKAFKEYCK